MERKYTKYQLIVMGKTVNEKPMGEDLDSLGVTVSNRYQC